MAFEAQVQAAGTDIEQQRILIADNLNIDRVAPLISSEFSRGEPVELQFLGCRPTMTTLFWKTDVTPSDPVKTNRMFRAIADNYKKFISDNYPSVQRWNPGIDLVSYEQNNLFFRWRAKTGNVNLAEQLQVIFNQVTPIISSQAGFGLDPLVEWQIGDIVIYSYTQRGIEIIQEIEESRRNIFEKFIDGIGNLTSSRVVGIPTIFWLTAGVIVIPEITRTIREFTD